VKEKKLLSRSLVRCHRHIKIVHKWNVKLWIGFVLLRMESINGYSVSVKTVNFLMNFKKLRC